MVPGGLTSTETIDTVMRLLKKIGKTAVLMAREAPGFIVNPLQMELMREAFYMVE